MKNQNLKQKIGQTMKCIFFCLALFHGALKAQDKLVYTNGDELMVIVQEITDAEVKFLTADNPSGPLRSVSKSEIFCIYYKNGKKELFSTEINKSEPRYAPVPVTPPQKREDWDPDTSDFAKRKRKNFSGPRVGVTYICPGTTADYFEYKGKMPITISFGWQFEKRLFTVEDGTSGLIEFVPLIGGINQGLFLPSANFLLGLRGGSDRSWEFAIGPQFGMKADQNKHLQGAVGVVIAFGTSFKKGNVWFPVNIALVPSVGSSEQVKDPVTGVETTNKYQTGWKISLIAGFNSRRR
ncbi:MAG: hypothetical protein JNK73_05455 [Bacteroidia bacterium]|nr:hypothetical protein [Bacteroidia bacterium]